MAEEKTESYNLLRAAVQETVKKMVEAAVGDDEKKSYLNNQDETEVEFFKNNAEIYSVSEKMRTKNERHPLYDLTSWEQEQWSIELAELILKSKFVDLSNTKTLKESLNRIYEFEYHCHSQMKKRMNSKNDYGLLYFLGFNLARSRLNMLLLKENKIKSHLTVIVPMWGEQNRMQSKEVHKNGEDFIRRKVSQLNWLYQDINSDLMDWNIIFVDDGCPHNSGNEALKLIENDKSNIFTNDVKMRISVEFLAKGLEIIDKFKNDETLKTVNDSRKGGAVQMGMYMALKQKVKNGQQHFIIYTDSDLSANIGQSGLLLADITINDIKNERKAVISDRYKKGIYSKGYMMGNNPTNAVAIHLRSTFLGELLPPFKNLYDTQCGFKLFKRECIEKILPKLTLYKGMFDMEVLLKAYDVYYDEIKEKREYIYPTGVVWLHSAAETAFIGYNVDTFTVKYGWQHYNFIKEIIKIHNDNYKNNKLCDPKWVQYVLNLSWKDYFKICQIAFLTKYDIDTWSPTVDDLKKMVDQQKYPENAPKWIENPDQK